MVTIAEQFCDYHQVPRCKLQQVIDRDKLATDKQIRRETDFNAWAILNYELFVIQLVEISHKTGVF